MRFIDADAGKPGRSCGLGPCHGIFHRKRLLGTHTEQLERLEVALRIGLDALNILGRYETRL